MVSFHEFVRLSSTTKQTNLFSNKKDGTHVLYVGALFLGSYLLRASLYEVEALLFGFELTFFDNEAH
ncbi:hypothetical protein B6A27_17455 [Anoxybacillus sp. UARK-01]|nr:hypothetical protein B6A27_17455 [Anoxybacillus sp. UARK-01]